MLFDQNFLLILLFFSRKYLHTSPLTFLQNVRVHLLLLIIIVGVVIVHLLEVNVLDAFTTDLVGIDGAAVVQSLENGAVYWLSQHSHPVLVSFLVVMYIGVYPFTLWFSPLYFILTDERNAMKTLAYGLLIIYVIALPFYLFIPVTNVYSWYGSESALESVIPTVEQFFYTTTTTNNCLPSLHVAMTLLIARAVSLTQNKRFMYLAYFCAGAVIVGVIYLAIHWLIDVVAGMILAGIAWYGTPYLLREK